MNEHEYKFSLWNSKNGKRYENEYWIQSRYMIINFIKVVENKKMIRTYLFIEFIKSFWFD